MVTRNLVAAVVSERIALELIVADDEQKDDGVGSKRMETVRQAAGLPASARCFFRQLLPNQYLLPGLPYACDEPRLLPSLTESLFSSIMPPVSSLGRVSLMLRVFSFQRTHLIPATVH